MGQSITEACRQRYLEIENGRRAESHRSLHSCQENPTRAALDRNKFHKQRHTPS
jgi:hypothetical protein